MSELDYILERVAAGYRVRFRDDHYGGVYAISYPATSFYPRYLLKFHRGVRLSAAEAAQVRHAMRQQRAHAT